MKQLPVTVLRDKRFGDRQNELVIIGQHLNQAQVMAEWQDCLCTELELKHMENDGAFEDPFPVWEWVTYKPHPNPSP